MSSQKKIAYVVFKGRIPGLYLDWLDCKAQVNRFKGNFYQGYDTYEDAESAWIAWCIEHGHNEEYARLKLPQRRSMVHHTGEGSSTESYSSDIIAKQLAPASESDEFIHQVSIQFQLEQVCHKLCVPLPTYTLEAVKNVNGREYRRYHAALTAHAIGVPPFSIGRFGKNDYDAREDAAVVLLRRLLDASGKKIRDYNYYSVQLLEEEVNRLKEETTVLSMQAATLSEQMKDLNSLVLLD